MKDTIRQHALALGFDACSFAAAHPPESAPHYREWLQQGRHGAMTYLVRQLEKRTEPEQVLPGIRTVVSLAASYSLETPPPAPDEDSASARIARYARHADYHRILAQPLADLAAFIEQTGGPSIRALAYSDTGPVLERDFAHRGGLGFVGKHTNLIGHSLGNWLLLAEILTTLPLEPDPPAKNRCGTCTRCLKACPTGALDAPFRLDARLCIAYLTIELKGPIPETLRPAIGDRAFGCDDCLEVCPWNRFAREGSLMSSARRPDLDRIPLLELLRLDEPGFLMRFRDTPMRRGGRRRLLRNVCVALGNVGNASALPDLQQAALEPEPLIAEHARWAIRRIESRAGSRATD